MAFRFDAMDDWLEEDEPILGHPRDPYHRVDVRQGSDHVRVLAGGEILADTARPKLLFETGLPTRWYIPPQDVRTGLLIESDTTTVCPYKGRARYRSLAAGDRPIEDVAFASRGARGSGSPVLSEPRARDPGLRGDGLEARGPGVAAATTGSAGDRGGTRWRAPSARS